MLITIGIVKRYEIETTRNQAPKSAMIRIWGRLNECKVVGLKGLINLNDGLRYSLTPPERVLCPFKKHRVYDV